MQTQINDIKTIQDDIVNLTSVVNENITRDEYNNIVSNIHDLRDKIVKATLANIVNVIDKIIEDGTTNEKGKVRQYTVSCVQYGSNSYIYLQAYEILDYDMQTKEVKLAPAPSLVDFTDVVRIY